MDRGDTGLAKQRAVFVDLHGTLGDVHGDVLGDFPEFSLYEFAADALRGVNEAGLLAIAVTNQTRIAAGRFGLDQFDRYMRDLEQELNLAGARLDAVYCCPHARDAGCRCHKPLPGLIEQAERAHAIDVPASYVVGDTGNTDILLARAVGCRGVLVRTGWGESSLGQFRDTWADTDADYVARDVLDAARWIAAAQ